VRDVGFAIEPEELPRVHYVIDYDGSDLLPIEPYRPTNAWSGPTWDGDSVAYWDHYADAVKIADYSDVNSPVELHSISGSAIAAAMGRPSELIEYQHGDLRNGKLFFSTINYNTRKGGLCIYDLATATLKVLETEYELHGGPYNSLSGVDFASWPKPSLSCDGTRGVYLTKEGVIVRVIGQSSIPARPPFMSWKAGDVSVSAWQTFLDSIPADATTQRAKPPTPSYRIQVRQGEYLQAIVNNELGEMQIDGSLDLQIHTASHSGSSMLQPYAPEELISGVEFRTRDMYRFDVDFAAIDPTWAATLDYGSLFKIIGPFSADWLLDGGHPITPSLDIRLVAGGNLEVIVRGTVDVDANDWEFEDTTAMPLVLGSHKLSVWWRHDVSQLTSYAAVEIDGDPVVSYSGEKLGTPFGAGTPRFGIETPRLFAASGVGVNFTRAEVFKLN